PTERQVRLGERDGTYEMVRDDAQVDGLSRHPLEQRQGLLCPSGGHVRAPKERRDAMKRDRLKVGSLAHAEPVLEHANGAPALAPTQVAPTDSDRGRDPGVGVPARFSNAVGLLAV